MWRCCWSQLTRPNQTQLRISFSTPKSPSPFESSVCSRRAMSLRLSIQSVAVGMDVNFWHFKTFQVTLKLNLTSKCSKMNTPTKSSRITQVLVMCGRPSEIGWTLSFDVNDESIQRKGTASLAWNYTSPPTPSTTTNLVSITNQGPNIQLFTWAFARAALNAIYIYLINLNVPFSFSLLYYTRTCALFWTNKHKYKITLLLG